jgi:hypothetical protein
VVAPARRVHGLRDRQLKVGPWKNSRTGSFDQVRAWRLRFLNWLHETFAAASGELTEMKSDATPNPEKPPEQWVTGEEPMTGPQISYLQTLCREAGEEFDRTLTKADASKKIEKLQAKTGRGKAT